MCLVWGEYKLHHVQHEEAEEHLRTSYVQGEPRAGSWWDFPEGYANLFPDTAPEIICVGRAPRLPVSVKGLNREVKMQTSEWSGL